MRRWIDRLALRVRSLLHGEQADRELQHEFQEHLEEEIEENIRIGMTPHEARTAALRAFGPIGRISEECRDTRRVSLIQNLLQDLRYTLRSLAQQPFLLVAATLSIAVAVGANTTIFNLASQLLLVDAVRVTPGSPRDHSNGFWQPRVVSAVAGPGAQPRPCGSRRISDRSRGQLAREGSGREPDAVGRHGQLFRRARRAARDGPRIHCRRGAGRAASRRGGHQPRILGTAAGSRSRGARQAARDQRRAVHRARCPAGRPQSVSRAMASRRKSTCPSARR